MPGADVTTSDILVETLIDWGATHVFGLVGDGINSIIESLRKRQDRIRYVAVRHEEAAALMAPGLPYAIAAKLAYPDRPSIAVVGDSGFAMLMAELTTAVANKLPVKIIILKNNSLAEVKFEQKGIGNPEYGCDLAPIDFVAFAKACGAEGFRCEKPEEVKSAIQAALNSSGVAVVEAVVDAEEKPAKPGELKA